MKDTCQEQGITEGAYVKDNKPLNRRGKHMYPML